MQPTDNPQSLESFADSLLMPSQEGGEPETEEPETQEVENEEEASEAPADEQTEEEEAEAGEAEAEQDDDDQEDEGDEQPDLITVKVDGEETQVTLEDLKRSYSGQGYIQKRMQEIADNKKEVEAVYQQLAQERAQVAQFVQQLQQGGAPQPPKMPDQELAQKDPQAFSRQMGEYLIQKEKWDQFQAQSQKQTQAHSEAQERARQAYLADQARQLQAVMPEFAEPEKAKEIRSKLLSVGQEYGYSQEELAGITDARAVQVLNDARQWRELQASKSKTAEKVAKARPVVKPGAKKTNGKQAERDKKRQQLKRSGSINDALDLLFE